MEVEKMKEYIQNVVNNAPKDWLELTTHRLDIYEEDLAKIQFLDQFEELYNKNISDTTELSKLPTAYDYVRLGHPLSCVLEWTIAKMNDMNPLNVITFSSKSIAILAILRKNSLENKSTQIVYSGDLPQYFDTETIKNVYEYDFEVKKVQSADEVTPFEGSVIYLSQNEDFFSIKPNSNIDFYINQHETLGSILLIHGKNNENYISDVQHVRRRETVAMTPDNCFTVLQLILDKNTVLPSYQLETNKIKVQNSINEVTGTTGKPLVATSGLSIQYAIMMGLVHDAFENHRGKKVKFLVPPNCYGGTNDQARRVAEAIENVEIIDLLVDRENDMVQSIDKLLTQVAKEDAVPYIIAEIPTNPRVEVPDLTALKKVLSKERKTESGETAIDPVFVLDQTFCPNYLFLGEGKILSTMRAISFASGSKFPSGGKVTAGYCVGNNKTEELMKKIETHLLLCDNEATAYQYKVLAEQIPTMNERILSAYQNTRKFVNYIHEVLPQAKINFVSEELANQGFTPSVFSLDLPTKGETEEEKEAYKRALNLKLINLMITEIPQESKFCVSYGQLKGVYWTVPATSTQGTTKEGDKDYIVRVSLSGNMDLELHKKVFKKFVDSL